MAEVNFKSMKTNLWRRGRRRGRRADGGERADDGEAGGRWCAWANGGEAGARR
jgi:hypothetical protein